MVPAVGAQSRWWQRHLDIIHEAWTLPAQPHLAPWVAWLAVALAYLFGWGLSVVTAVQYLQRPWLPSGGMTWMHAILSGVFNAGKYAVLIALTLTLCRGLCKSDARSLGLGAPRGRREWGIALMLPAIGLATVYAATMIPEGLGFEYNAYPAPATITVPEWSNAIADGVTAGFAEEILLVVVPVTVLRAARQPWVSIFAFCLMARWIFHLYYGWASLGLLFWAGSFLLLYLRFRMVWPLIAVHALHNVMSMLNNKTDFAEGIYSWFLAAVTTSLVLGAGIYTRTLKNTLTP